MGTCQISASQKQGVNQLTEQLEPKKVYVRPSGVARIVCPNCGMSREVKIPETHPYKCVLVKCNCQQRFPVIIEKRSFHRKKVSLTGDYWNSLNEKDCMTVITLSMRGIGFETRGKPSLSVGDKVRVSFILDDGQHTRINEKVEIKRVDGCKVGAEFSRLGEYEQKAIGFYLM